MDIPVRICNICYRAIDQYPHAETKQLRMEGLTARVDGGGSLGGASTNPADGNVHICKQCCHQLAVMLRDLPIT